MKFSTRKMVGVAAAGAAAVGLMVATAGFASASPPTTGTVNASVALSGGTFSLTAPNTLAFPDATEGAADQSLNASLALDVLDETGSGAGWDVTLTSTTFANGSVSLPTGATSDTGATGACDAATTCTLADNSAIAYPLTVPAGTVAPQAIVIAHAAAGSGMAGQTWTNAMALALPANTPVGGYTSTWTYSLVSAP